MGQKKKPVTKITIRRKSSLDGGGGGNDHGVSAANGHLNGSAAVAFVNQNGSGGCGPKGRVVTLDKSAIKAIVEAAAAVKGSMAPSSTPALVSNSNNPFETMRSVKNGDPDTNGHTSEALSRLSSHEMNGVCESAVNGTVEQNFLPANQYMNGDSSGVQVSESDANGFTNGVKEEEEEEATVESIQVNGSHSVEEASLDIKEDTVEAVAFDPTLQTAPPMLQITNVTILVNGVDVDAPMSEEMPSHEDDEPAPPARPPPPAPIPPTRSSCSTNLTLKSYQEKMESRNRKSNKWRDPKSYHRYPKKKAGDHQPEEELIMEAEVETPSLDKDGRVTEVITGHYVSECNMNCIDRM